MKKGFTLIELLAVILILGIIALIAIPTVNNILKEARRGAFSSTLTNIEKTIENECTLSQIKNQKINHVYTIKNGTVFPKVEIKGNLPDGTIYINDSCEMSYILFDNNFTGNKELGEDVIVDEKKTNGIYKEQLLNGTDPILSNNLIPVRIEKDGTVFKADLNSKWYSYEEKKWANAVILTPTGKIENNGMILEESIESYFVWIPRYKYKLFNMGNYTSVLGSRLEQSHSKEIEIIFENKNVPVSNGDEVGEYLSHPAFGAFNVNGFWVGKFETSGTTENIKIKPNQVTLKKLSVKSIFETSYNYKRNNDSHMMKNTEWGMVTYLALSKYGINKNINLNNNSDYKTGYSAVLTTDQSKYPGTYGNNASITQPYNTKTGYLASTTGNISGVYDMSGGTHEYMASFTSLGTSEFESDPRDIYGNKYFDKYLESSTISSYNNRILGDATGEFGPFYIRDGFNVNGWWENSSNFLDSTGYWVDRGGYNMNGFLGGILYFGRSAGNDFSHIGFRIVLSS